MSDSAKLCFACRVALRRTAAEHDATGGDGGGDDEDDGGLQAELDDLLVCLGQEEQKVAILSEKLLELGVDADSLVQHITLEDDGDGDSVEGTSGVDVHQWIAESSSPPIQAS